MFIIIIFWLSFSVTILLWWMRIANILLCIHSVVGALIAQYMNVHCALLGSLHWWYHNLIHEMFLTFTEMSQNIHIRIFEWRAKQKNSIYPFTIRECTSAIAMRRNPYTLCERDLNSEFWTPITTLRLYFGCAHSCRHMFRIDSRIHAVVAIRFCVAIA